MEVRKRKRNTAGASRTLRSGSKSGEDDGDSTSQAFPEHNGDHQNQNHHPAEQQQQQQHTPEQAPPENQAEVENVWKSVTKSVLDEMGLPFHHEDPSLMEHTQNPKLNTQSLPSDFNQLVEIMETRGNDKRFEKEMTIHQLYERMVKHEIKSQELQKQLETSQLGVSKLEEELQASRSSLASALEELKQQKDLAQSLKDQLIKKDGIITLLNKRNRATFSP